MRISDWSSDVCSSDLPALNVGGIEHRLSRTRGGGDELFVTPDIARRGQSTRPTGDRDNPFLDRHLDAVILDPDDEFGPDRAHLHPVGADDTMALTVVRVLEPCLSASHAHAPYFGLLAHLPRRLSVTLPTRPVLVRVPPATPLPGRTTTPTLLV